jgi:hypothetical protein
MRASVVLLLAIILVVSRAARAEVVCGYTVNSNPGPGEGFFKYTPCEDSDKKFRSSKDAAKNYLTKERSKLKKAIKDRFGILPNNSDFARAQKAIDDARKLNNQEWERFLRDNPGCRGSDACTRNNQEIAIHNEGDPTLISHEGIHIVIDNAADRGRREVDNESLDAFIYDWLSRHH